MDAIKPHSKKNSRARSRLTRILLFPLSFCAITATAWTFGALYYDGPARLPGGWNLILALVWLTSVSIIAVKAQILRLWQIRLLVCCLPIYIYWLSIRPSNDRNWKPEFAETGYVDIDGDQLTFHKVRNFDYRADGSPAGIITERWETRQHHLSKLRGVDLHFDAFGGKLMAHPMLSFDFGKEGHLVLSIETRREQHESFSAIGGIYKMFELQYIFGDEADLVRVRSNIRDEPMYLYRTITNPEQARQLLLECVRTQNQLKDHPYWYNAITANCTTSYRAQTPSDQRNPFDWRLLVNGQLDQMLYEKGAFATDGLPFEKLRAQALINEVAQQHAKAEGFSQAIRKGRAGFTDKK
ncbi:DUF4105 domain-containing protein [Verrucomicrobiaceae bacterium N1E253]|uniref:DUF4105 domain-containing protein n=1 Tax=Oceaniferula marina TaxID=2748318 RepID=A0A851GKX2_9BACT|nr:DUF4105 domain-containing protein [Oceaniferula marina]NWK54814.1 DUF4105 domain-containing protein [Oceaniferula marina]